MEPFRITCETCRSRLKIRSPEVIGEIHACPKCGSMVHILPPAGWTPGAEVNVAAAPSFSGDAALAITTTASVIIPASALATDFAPPGPIEPPPAQVPVADAPVVDVSPAEVAPAASTFSPVVMWSASALTVLLISVATYALWPKHQSKDENVAASSIASEAQPPAVESKSTTPAAKPVDQPKTTPKDPYAVDHTKEKAAATPPAAPPPSERKNTEAAANKRAVSNALPQSPPQPSKAENTIAAAIPKPDASVAKAADALAAIPPAAAADATKSADAPANEAQHQPVLKFDPLNFDPDRLGTNGRSSSPPAGPTNSIPDRAPAPAVDEHAPANGADPGAIANAANAQPRNVEPPPAAPPAISVRRGQPAADAAAPKKPAQPLAFQLKSIQLNAMPLGHAVETLGNISGTSITLDPIALEFAAVSQQTPVSLDAQNITLEAALQKTLAPQRLAFVVEGDHIRVALQKPDDRREVDYDVKDLVTGDDASSVAQLVEKFVAPATWKSAGGAGTIQVKGTTLSIEQSDVVRRQIVMFCERLRLARKLPLRSKYPKELLSVDPPYQKLAAKLNQPTTFTFLPWTRFAEVIGQLREMTGLSILVDWGALEEAQLNPSSPIACSANNRSWQEALDGVLEPLGLAWWAVDTQTIQITSRSAIANIHRIEFYSAKSAGQSVIDSLQKELAAAGGNGKASEVRIAFDEASSRLIVLATPEQHRLLSQRLPVAKQ